MLAPLSGETKVGQKVDWLAVMLAFVLDETRVGWMVEHLVVKTAVGRVQLMAVSTGALMVGQMVGLRVGKMAVMLGGAKAD